VAWAEGHSHLKIGWSRADPQERVSALNTGCPTKIHLLAELETNDPRHEIEIHKALSSKRARGEWFDATLDEVVSVASAIAPNAPINVVDRAVAIYRGETTPESAFKTEYTAALQTLLRQSEVHQRPPSVSYPKISEAIKRINNFKKNNPTYLKFKDECRRAHAEFVELYEAGKLTPLCLVSNRTKLSEEVLYLSAEISWEGVWAYPVQFTDVSLCQRSLVSDIETRRTLIVPDPYDELDAPVHPRNLKDIKDWWVHSLPKRVRETVRREKWWDDSVSSETETDLPLACEIKCPVPPGRLEALASRAIGGM
jgi:hypothetical protein